MLLSAGPAHSFIIIVSDHYSSFVYWYIIGLYQLIYFMYFYILYKLPISYFYLGMTSVLTTFILQLPNILPNIVITKYYNIYSYILSVGLVCIRSFLVVSSQFYMSCQLPIHTCMNRSTSATIALVIDKTYYQHLYR